MCGIICRVSRSLPWRALSAIKLTICETHRPETLSRCDDRDRSTAGSINQVILVETLSAATPKSTPGYATTNNRSSVEVSVRTTPLATAL